MAGKAGSAGDKAKYGNYKTSNQYTKNRERRLKRHLKDHPNDGAAKKAVGNIKYRRQKPLSKKWSRGEINLLATLPRPLRRTMAKILKTKVRRDEPVES